MPIDLFAFDMAGTTVQDDDVVLQTFLDVAAGEELPVEPEWLRARMGWDKAAVFSELLARSGRQAALASELALRFQEHLAARYERQPPRAIAGVAEAFEALEARGVRIGFTTGFARATADLILERIGWSHLPSVASDEVDHGRPAPDLIFELMRRTGFRDVSCVGAAGDTPSDLLAASAAGCGIVVGVGTGSHRLVQLRAAPHTHLVDDLRGLGAIVDGGAR